MAQPIVSYPGAKWRFYPHMVEYFPTDMKVFIEPFFGGGSVSLSVADDPRFEKLERMIGGDLYTEMWAFWEGLKQDPAAVEQVVTQWFNKWCPHQVEAHNSGFICGEARKYLEGGECEKFETLEGFTEEDRSLIKSKIALYNTACNEAQAFWDWAQSVDPTTLTLPERAARTWLVNRFSFSGMGDAGSLSKDRYCEFKLDSVKKMYDTSKLLQRIELYNVSFEETMKMALDKPNDTFIFLDPPYAKQEGSGLYGKNGSTHRGFPHEEFAKFTMQMPCKWFMTYDDSVIVRKLFAGNTYFGTPCCLKPFTIPGGYTMAVRTAEDALAGEELFISNMDLDASLEDEEYDF